MIANVPLSCNAGLRPAVTPPSWRRRQDAGGKAAKMAAVLFFLIALPLRAAEVRVFAAASLADALREIAANYKEDKIIFNFAGSSTLARQIEEGAPADLFISADEETMDALQKKNLIAVDTRTSLLSNTLVIVVAGAGVSMPHDLARVHTLALAEPSTVPAGIYAKKYLQKIGIWDRVAARVIPTENVRGALAAVEAGNADAAIVYKTDALASRKVRIAYEVPRDEGPVISYAFAATAEAENGPAARRFLEYLASEAALDGFRRHGFLVDSRRAGRPATAGGTPALQEWQILGFTVRVAALAALLIVPPGLAIAWLLARQRWRGKSLVETLVALPLVMPPVATGLILLKLFGRRGPIGSHLPIDVVFTWRGVVLAMMVMSFPLLVRSARVAFEEVNPRFEQIARSLGARDARVFFTITLPLGARGIISGILLAFARSLGEFGATILVAGNIPGRTSTLSVSIYNFVQLGRDDDAFRLLFLAVAIAFAAVWIAEFSSRRSGAKL